MNHRQIALALGFAVASLWFVKQAEAVAPLGVNACDRLIVSLGDCLSGVPDETERNEIQANFAKTMEELRALLNDPTTADSVGPACLTTRDIFSKAVADKGCAL